MSNPFIQIYPIEPIRFNGGMVNKFEKNMIQDNESPDCLNVTYGEGSVETRKGTAKVNTTSVGSFVCDGLYTRTDNSGAQTMCLFAGGSLYTLGGVSTFTTVPSAQSVFAIGTRVATCEYENYMFIGQSGLSAYKYNGSEFTSHGIPAPEAIPTVTSNSVGALTGDYRYKVSYVNSAIVEGDVGPASVTFTVAGGALRVVIPTAPVSHGVNSRRIYRTEAGGSTYKLAGTVANNTATTFDDNALDAALGVTAPTDQGQPPKYTVCFFHRDRLFLLDPSNDNYLWYSELGNPYVVKSTNFIRLGDRMGDQLKTIACYDNSIIVGSDESKYVVYMPDTDPANWQSFKSKSPYGCKSPFGIVEYNNKIFFPAFENGVFVGFADFAGDTVQASQTFLTVQSVGSYLNSNPIEPDMNQVQRTYGANISSISYKSKIYIALTFGSGNTINNRIYTYDFSIKDLSKRQRFAWAPWAGLSAAQFTVYDGNLYYGSSVANGHVYKMEQNTYNDDGNPINSYFYTKEFSGFKGHENKHKDFRYANFLIDLAGDYYMDFATRVDSDAYDSSAEQIDLDPGSALFGSAKFGIDVFGSGAEQRDLRQFLGSLRGKRIQFKFSNRNQVNQRFKVHWLRLSYIPGGLR